MDKIIQICVLVILAYVIVQIARQTWRYARFEMTGEQQRAFARLPADKRRRIMRKMDKRRKVMREPIVGLALIGIIAGCMAITFIPFARPIYIEVLPTLIEITAVPQSIPTAQNLPLP